MGNGTAGAAVGERTLILAEPEPLARPPVPQVAPLLALPAEQVRSGPLLAACLPLLQAGRRVYCLDGANRFDPYRLAALARRQGADPLAVLERVLVSRAFTCHQLVEAALTLLPPLLEPAGQSRTQPEELAQTSQPGQPLAELTNPREPPLEAGPPLALILGIDRLFLEDEIPLAERRRLFGRLLNAVERLRQQGLPLLITFQGEPGTPWVEALRRVALCPGGDGPGLRRALAGWRRQLTRPPGALAA